MKLTIIGYWGAYPEKGEATSCYLLEKDDFCLMIDCGSGALSRLPFYKNIDDVDAVILSHYHQDHIADIGVLQYNRLIQNALHKSERMLPVYGHEENREAFDRLSHVATKGVVYHPEGKVKIGPFEIRFLKTAHPVPCYGMRITDGSHSIVYTADTSFSPDWIQFSQDADLLVAECSFYADQDGSEQGHMNSIEAAEIAGEANVKELILSHFPHFGNRKNLKLEAESKYAGKIQMAEEGLVWQKE